MIGINNMQDNYRSLYLATIDVENEMKVSKYETCKFQKPIPTLKPDKIIFGKSLICRRTEMSGARDKPAFDGNNVFFWLGKIHSETHWKGRKKSMYLFTD